MEQFGSTLSQMESNMNIVLTMAGLYTRFRRFGARVPKYLMPAGNGTVLSQVIRGLVDAKSAPTIWLVANKRNIEFFPVLSAVMNEFGIPKENLAFISDTKSQLETALTGISQFPIKDSEKIVFHNVDTVLLERDQLFANIAKLSPDCSLVDTFPASSHYYSYILPDENDVTRVRLIKDCVLVSSKACSGLYAFGSIAFFRREAEKIVVEGDNQNFTYLLRQLIDQGYNVSYYESSDPAKTIVIGNPDEYLAAINRFR